MLGIIIDPTSTGICDPTTSNSIENEISTDLTNTNAGVSNSLNSDITSQIEDKNAIVVNSTIRPKENTAD